MQVDLIETYAEFERLKSNWNHVYQSDPEAKFFLSWIWFSQVFKRYLTGWCVLAAKRETESGRYVAFFPLRLKTRMSKSRRQFVNEIHMGGSFFWADYTGIICSPEYEEEAIQSICIKLKQMNWTKLYLKHFDVSEKRLAFFTGHFDGSMFLKENRNSISARDSINNLICPYIELSDDFETYLMEKLSANTRQKFRRFMRKVENSEDFRITHSVPETDERDLDILIDFWKKRWVHRKGKDVEKLGYKYKEIMQTGLEGGTVYMPMLWRGDTPLGGLGSFVDRQKKSLLYFVAGRDESYTNPPTGFVLHAHSIRWAIENGLKTYDFLRGDESYKYSFGATKRRIKYVVLSTKSGTNLNRTLDPRCIDDVLEQSARYQKYGRFKEAEIGYRQVLEACPKNLAALRRYGRLLYSNNRFAEAQKIYQELVDCDPGNAAGWRRLGKARFALHEFTDAEFALRTAIELSPTKTVDLHYYLGRALQELGMQTEAAFEFNAVLNLIARDEREKRQQKNARNRLEQHA